MRPIALIFAGSTLVIGALLAWFIASQTVDWIESSQTAEVEQALFAGGITWAVGMADGTLLTLEGEAPDSAQQGRASQIATMIMGENLINNTTEMRIQQTTAATIVQPSLEILKNGLEISLIGRVNEDDTFNDFMAAISDIDDDVILIDLIEPIKTVSGEDWVQALHFAGRVLTLTERSILMIEPGRVEINTVAGSADWQVGLEELLENMRPELVQLSINITAPRQVISPYILEVDLDGETAVICSAQDEIEAEVIQASLLALGLDVPQCQVGLGAPSSDWAEVVITCVDVLTQTGGGHLSIENTDIDIIAPAGTDPAILLALSAKLPDVFSLHTSIERAPLTEEEAAMVVVSTFHAELAIDGLVAMNGTMKDDLTTTAVLRYAEAKFGYNLVDGNFIQKADIPDGWQIRIFAAIEALALLESGQVEVTPEALTLRGVASFEAPEVELLALFESAIGRDAGLVLDISYEPKEDAEEDTLDPRICASRITTMLSENQISFAPSSAVIEDLSTPTIEAMALILTNCRGARFEIGGHTDSQGREEMNRSLSQSRADAVLDALLAQNLLLGEVTAVGYGEAEPIADNETEEGRAQNRRIEFKMIRDVDENEEDEASDE